MIARQTPLCVRHFMVFARHALPSDTDPKPSPLSSVKRRRGAPSSATAPFRVQPRRAAKDRNPMYNDDAETGKRKAEDSDENRERKPRKKRKTQIDISELPRKIDDIVPQISRGRECVFGPKPWVCNPCEEERARANRKLALPFHSGSRAAPEADMDVHPLIMPDSANSLLRGWEDVVVPEERRFQLRDRWFAVDVCGRAMVLML